MANNKYRILLVEDDTNIMNFINTTLEAADYYVVLARTCSEAFMMFSSYKPDLVILDLGLPDKDGIEFLKEIRKTEITPIIVLSARALENDKVLALDLGANDYITKPFSSLELLARIRTALRGSIYSNSSFIFDGTFTLNNLSIEYDTRQVFFDKKEIKLTLTEYNILALLSKSQGKLLTYSAIIKNIWGFSDEGSVKKLQVNMANIRKKMGVKPGDDTYIINELGVGYRMNVNKDKEDFCS